MATTTDRERVERCARMYRTNKQMAEAMGVSDASVSRWCRKFGIASPSDRRKVDAGPKKPEPTPDYPEELGPNRRDAMAAGDLAERRAQFRREGGNDAGHI